MTWMSSSALSPLIYWLFDLFSVDALSAFWSGVDRELMSVLRVSFHQCSVLHSCPQRGIQPPRHIPAPAITSPNWTISFEKVRCGRKIVNGHCVKIFCWTLDLDIDLVWLMKKGFWKICLDPQRSCRKCVHVKVLWHSIGLQTFLRSDFLITHTRQLWYDEGLWL